MKYLVLPSILFLLLIGGGTTVFGASDTFRVQTLIGDDMTPPTIPTSLVALPVATTQINLSWGSSTDDFFLSGYTVYRDDIQIATTTGTTYADTGLTPSTMYAYYVTAFDSFANVSASSTVVSTTTLTPSVPSATSSPSTVRYGSLIRNPFEIITLEVIPNQTSAIIRYDTQGFVRSIVHWGKSISYETGSLVEHTFSTHHEIEIHDLVPNTRYFFSIEGEGNRGVVGLLTENNFMTLPTEDITPPANVRNVRAVRDGQDIKITWDNPSDPDFDHARVLRSTLFYPSDSADGWVIFDGTGERAIDTRVALPNTRHFYTIFAYDKKGNISSGAVVSIGIPSDSGTSSEVIVIDTTKNELHLLLSDIHLYQNGEPIFEQSGVHAIDGSSQFIFEIPYERLPEHLKTIMVTVTDTIHPNLSFTFLLRANAEKTAYRAILAPLGVSGMYSFQVSVFDYKTAQVGYVFGTLSSTITAYESHEKEFTFIEWLLQTKYFYMSVYAVFFLVLCVLLTNAVRKVLVAR